MFAVRNVYILVLCSCYFVFVSANSIITNEVVQGGGIVMELRKKLVLQCNVTGKSVPIIWHKDGSLVNVTSRVTVDPGEGKLTINKAELDDAGSYECHADNLKATIKVSAKVSIEQFPKSLNFVQGDTLRLQCKATGVPTPRITWFKEDVPIGANSSDDRVELKPNDKNLTDGMLVIRDLDYEDRANYRCFAENGLNLPANETVLVRIKDKLAALWPFLGICAEVAILCTIIFIYEKKRVKPDFDESDTDQIPESKNVGDKDKVPDVRHRK